MNPNDIPISHSEMLYLQNYQIFALHQKLAEAKNEIDCLKKELEDTRQQQLQTQVNFPKKIQYWSEEEHAKFLEALEIFGSKNVKEIAKFLGTRTPAQVRSHAQKYFLKLKKQGKLKTKKFDQNKQKKRTQHESDESDESDDAYDADENGDANEHSAMPAASAAVTATISPSAIAHAADANAASNALNSRPDSNQQDKLAIESTTMATHGHGPLAHDAVVVPAQFQIPSEFLPIQDAGVQ
jgi:SHAQKYF class myb-like DNA-binding protein